MVETTCSIDGCTRSVVARGWCSLHYGRWGRRGSPEPEPLNVKQHCTVEGCVGFVKGRGWCGLHYRRWRVHGDVRAEVPPLRRPDFWEKVDKNGPTPPTFWDPVLRCHRYRPEVGSCWLWVGGWQRKTGYGMFGTGLLAHRFAYQLIVGAIRSGLELDHLCRVRLCVNPGHLEAVTHQENVARGLVATRNRERARPPRTHCSQGHFLEGNVYISGSHRQCRTCARDYRKRVQAARAGRGR